MVLRVRPPLVRRPAQALLGTLAATTLLLSACSGGAGSSREAAAAAQAPTAPTLLAATDPAELAIQASSTWFSTASYAMVAAPDDQASIDRAASIAAAAGVPVLLGEGTPQADSPVDQELDRLGADAVLTVGAVDPAEIDDAIGVTPAPADAGELGRLIGTEVTEVAADADPVRQLTALEPGQVLPAAAEPAGEPRGEFPQTSATERVEGSAVVTDGTAGQAAAVGTGRAAGAVAVVSPRVAGGTAEAMQKLAGATGVVGLGGSYDDQESFAWGVRAAQTGVELPGGGQAVFGGKRYVALYGSPITPSLGLLGEQGTEETIARAEQMAAPYAELTEDQVIPAQEIIVTVASSVAGPDGNYSTEFDSAEFLPLVEAAEEAGHYVVLDFQPGRTDFTTQVRRYEDLLKFPHVGVALDPEWRLEPNEVHLTQIGSVDIEEVNEVAEYLAGFVAANDLPQKLLVLHQFQVRMIPERDRLDTSHPEVALLVHADGQGSQGDKQATWGVLHQGAPEGIAWGWKNFIDEDLPMLTPEQTYTQVDPVPEFVSYQ